MKFFINTLIIFFILSLAVYTIFKIKSYNRQKDIQLVIQNLENFKKEYGRYPVNSYVNISKYNALTLQDKDWLYYMSDSTGNSYRLAYSHGFIDWNTTTYYSETKAWKTIFNY